MGKYELLIFDADHTLMDFDKAEHDAISKVFDEYGVKLSDSMYKRYREINFALWKKFEKNEIDQQHIKIERFRIFIEETGIEANAEKCASHYLAYLSEGHDLLPGAQDLIEELEKQYKLALLTNGISEVQHPRYEKCSIYGRFDAYVVSGDVGISKPDKRIFDIVLNKCGITDRRKVLMIGDSLTSDILGGINSGLDTCWFNPSKKANNSNIRPDYEIVKLSDLKVILS